MTNLNLLFNKIYYQGLCGNEEALKDFSENLKTINETIFNATFDHKRDYQSSLITELIVKPEHCFLLKTAYPGLLIGTGNPHGSGKSDNDINVGFSFDYVTGQPFLPGSSVKGALRSHFREHPEAVAEILEMDLAIVKALEEEIFDGNDIFFDAVVFDGDKTGRLMDKDYITPHSTPTKNPKPIFIIKVLPDVRFEFRFILKDGMITADEKRDLFKKLLRLFGIGAKTNVGYGILEECDNVIVGTKQNKPDSTSRQGHRSNPPKNNTKPNSERVVCPHCGTSNYKYCRDGNRRKKCYQCENFLFPKRY